MSNTFNANQFNQAPVVGQLDLTTNPNPAVISCRYNPSATSTLRLVNGEGVNLKDLGASDSKGSPIVDKRAANTDAVFGVKIFNTLENSSAPGSSVEIAIKGAVVYMKCLAAVARGEKVSLVVASTGEVKVLDTGYEEFGLALDKGATGDLIRVLITTDYAA